VERLRPYALSWTVGFPHAQTPQVLRELDTRDCVIGCGRCGASIGVRVWRCVANCWRWGALEADARKAAADSRCR